MALYAHPGEGGHEYAAGYSRCARARRATSQVRPNFITPIEALCRGRRTCCCGMAFIFYPALRGVRFGESAGLIIEEGGWMLFGWGAGAGFPVERMGVVLSMHNAEITYRWDMMDNLRYDLTSER